MTIELSAESQIEAQPGGSRGFDYQTPQFVRHDLRVITLGGASGSDDSGAVNTQEVFGAQGSYDEEFDSDNEW